MTGDQEASPVETKPLSSLECKRAGAVNGADEPLTVGSIFKVECTTTSFILNPSKLRFETKKPYQLKLLNSEIQPDGRIVLQVTSYQVGDLTSDGLVLTDGVSSLALTGVQAKIESVIDQKNPPKGPYGPFGGFVLSLPQFYLWTVIIVFLLSLLWMGFRFYRRWQRKRLIDGLKKHDSRLSPLTQLHVKFRQLERQRIVEQQKAGGITGLVLSQQFIEIEEVLRLFLIRAFKIPAHDWSDRLILNEFQSRFSFLGKDLAKELRFLLREIKKNKEIIQKNTGPVEMAKINDIERIIKKIKKWADQSDRNLSAIYRFDHSVDGSRL